MDQEQIAALTRRVWRLEQQVKELNGRLGIADEPAEPAAATSVAPAAPAAPAAGSRATPTPRGQRAAAIVAAPDRVRDEANVVGAWLARAGALAILIGAGFAFKYAVDRGIIGPAGRVAVGLLAGAAFIGWGEQTRRKGWDRFAQAVTGGGVALAYLSILAAVQLYDLIGAPVAFICLVAITALGGVLAHRHDSIALATLALVGGFFNPFLAHRNDANDHVVFLYLVALDLFVVATAARRWRPLEVVAGLGTIIVFGVARSDLSFAAEVSYATVLLAVFTVPPFLRPAPTAMADAAVPLSASFVYFGYVAAVVHQREPDALGAFALAMAAGYAALSAFARDRRPDDVDLSRALLTPALAFFALAVPLQLDGPSIVTAWAIQGVALLALGVRWRYGESAVAGGVLLALATVLSFAHLQDATPSQLLFSSDSVPAVMTVVALAAATIVLRDHRREWAAWSAAAANLVAITWLSAEAVAAIEREVAPAIREQASQFALSALWALYAAVLLAVGVRAALRPARLWAAGLLAVVVAKLVFNDLWMLQTGYRIAAFVGVGAVLLACSVMYQRLRDLILEEGR